MLSDERIKELWENLPNNDPFERYRDNARAIEAALLAEQAKAEPVAWAREWEGDTSDLGNMIVVFDKEDCDANTNWFPLYLHPAPKKEK